MTINTVEEEQKKMREIPIGGVNEKKQISRSSSETFQNCRAERNLITEVK